MSTRSKTRKGRTGKRQRKTTQRRLLTTSVQRIEVPASLSAVVRTTAPVFTSQGPNLIVSHTEFWHDESGGVNPFVITPYALNPGSEEVFPWLGRIASRFEKYKFRRLTVEYHPNCPTSTPGYFAIAIDADVSDSIPSLRSEMLAMENAVTGPCWSEMRCTFPLGGNRIRYVRVGGYPVDTDERTSDCGKIYISKGDQVFPSGIGSLWVRYEVELLIPQLHIEPASFITDSPGPSVKDNFIVFGAGINQTGTFATIVADGVIHVKKAGRYMFTCYGSQNGATTCQLDLDNPTVTNGGSAVLQSSVPGDGTPNSWYHVLYICILSVASTITIPSLILGTFLYSSTQCASYTELPLPSLLPKNPSVKYLLDKRIRKLDKIKNFGI